MNGYTHIKQEFANDFENQLLLQERDELRSVNMQYQSLNRQIVSKNISLTNENKRLERLNKELTDDINRLQDKCDRLTKNMQSTVSRQPRDIRYQARVPDNTVALLDTDMHVIISDLRVELERMTQERDKIAERYQTCQATIEELERKSQTMQKNVKKWEEICEKMQSEKADELVRDPRIVQMINKDKEAQINELKKQVMELNNRLDKTQATNSYDFNVTVKTEKDGNVSL